MYVWVGCDINPKFVEYREKVKNFNEELGLSLAAFEFPQHISLKITFEAEEEIAKHCIKDMIEYLKSVKPFIVKTGELELRDGILWLNILPCDELNLLHAELDEIGISYAVKQDPLDKQFIFHTTIVMDEDNEKLEKMFNKLKPLEYPEELKINTFLVGHSLDKQVYKVDRRIKVK